MKGVVLAAGEGTRLRPRTARVPKPLVEVAGKPLLTHCFEQLRPLGLEEIVVVVGYRGDEIVDAYGDSFDGLPLEYAHQAERRGLAHAVLQAADHVDEAFVLTYADLVFERTGGLERCVYRHRQRGPHATLLTASVSRARARKSGVVVRNEETGAVDRIVEKPSDPPSTRAIPGFFVFEPVVFSACRLVQPSDRGEYELPDAIDLLAYTGCEVELVDAEGAHVNVNTPEDLKRAERLLTNDR